MARKGYSIPKKAKAEKMEKRKTGASGDYMKKWRVGLEYTLYGYWMGQVQYIDYETWTGKAVSFRIDQKNKPTWQELLTRYVKPAKSAIKASLNR